MCGLPHVLKKIIMYMHTSVGKLFHAVNGVFSLSWATEVKQKIRLDKRYKTLRPCLVVALAPAAAPEPEDRAAPNVCARRSASSVK